MNPDSSPAESSSSSSSDALLRHGDALSLTRLAAQHKPLAIICALPSDAQRLLAEMAWFDPSLKLALLPDWETLPYDHFSPHADLVSERLATLYRMQRQEFDVVIVPASTALYRLTPSSYLAAHTFFLKQGGQLDIEALRSQLTLAGYTHVTQVMAPGEFCVRGGLIDLFPMGSALPYRIDLMDDVIDSIKTFDVDTQRSIYATREIRLLPAREFPMDEAGRNGFRKRFRDAFEGDASRSAVYKDVSNGIPSAGVEYFLPLFFDQTATLFDYLPPQSALCLHGDVHGAFDTFWGDARSRHRILAGDRSRPVLPPEALFLGAEDFFLAAKPLRRLDVPPALLPAPNVAVERRAADPLHQLKAWLHNSAPGDGNDNAANPASRTLILAETAGRRETMLESFAQYALRPASFDSFAEFLASDAPLGLSVSSLLNGFIDPATADKPALALLTESELYAGVARSHGQRARTSSVEGMLRDISELRAGDPVVHLQHGIGRYQGLTHLDLGEGSTEFLHIEYADGATLYVPVAQLHLISRYSGGPPEQAPLHRLGSDTWDKAKSRAAKQVRDAAAELLHLYAQRAAREGHSFGLNQHDYEAFAEGFGFEETPDQAAAISAVLADMTQGKPMDRLVCGDVGFGKTEVALRAAFIAVADRRQVAILAPTTLLAEQHFQTFSDRFADWGIRIAELSRFRTGKEQSAAMAGLASGDIDIVIGTHKLLQGSVKFARLGLVIVDEEHRFGVRQKESLKKLRAEVDVLTLTATPIPRTLALSLEGMRDLSVIATAPQRRLAIKTFVHPYSAGVIREAVMRELKRGGQVFFLHNEVETIQTQREQLAALLPEARIAVAHGQLHERDLERVMRDFVQQRFNLLLCSTIIETGIDIPNANTILINRADRFGLAQLHQLRGRVGRSHHQAYAYLLTMGQDSLTPAAKKRLEAIQMMEELGSGFYLAMHDLEIRGAGEVLGESQSGEMQEIGFNLYADMLNHAVRSLKAGKEPDAAQPFAATTEINLHLPALLPPAYCSDVHERLVIYKRLANCEQEDDLEAIQEELVDRFGPSPEPVRALLETHRLRLRGAPLGVIKLDAGPETLSVQFAKDAPLDPDRVVRLMQTQRSWKFTGPTRLRVEKVTSDLNERTQAARELLQKLTTAKRQDVLAA